LFGFLINCTHLPSQETRIRVFCFPDTVSGMWACLYRSGAAGHAWNVHQMTLDSVTNTNSSGKHYNGGLIVILEFTI